MAGRNYSIGRFPRVAASHPTTPAKNAPCRIGDLAGVALDNEDANGITRMTTSGVFDLSVKGVNAGGNSAVAIGEKLYYVDADTPNISKKNTGYHIGYAMATVGSGSTATIPVMLIHGSGKSS